MNVALHGFTGSTESWDGVLRAPATALALLGHGGPLSESFDHEVDRLARCIAQQAPVQLVGYSMGARLALGIACAHPELVARLVLIGVHPGLEDPDAIAERRIADESWCRILERDGIDAFLERWEALPMWRSQQLLDPAARQRQRAIRRSHDAPGLAHALRVAGLAAMPNLWPLLATLRIPVRLICGARDEKFRAIAERAATQIPTASVAIVPAAGHNPILEAPRATAALIENRSD